MDEKWNIVLFRNVDRETRQSWSEQRFNIIKRARVHFFTRYIDLDGREAFGVRQLKRDDWMQWTQKRALETLRHVYNQSHYSTIMLMDLSTSMNGFCVCGRVERSSGYSLEMILNCYRNDSNHTSIFPRARTHNFCYILSVKLIETNVVFFFTNNNNHRNIYDHPHRVDTWTFSAVKAIEANNYYYFDWVVCDMLCCRSLLLVALSKIFQWELGYSLCGWLDQANMYYNLFFVVAYIVVVVLRFLCWPSMVRYVRRVDVNHGILLILYFETWEMRKWEMGWIFMWM